MRNRNEIYKNENYILVSKKKKKRGYGEIGRRYGLALSLGMETC